MIIKLNVCTCYNTTETGFFNRRALILTIPNLVPHLYSREKFCLSDIVTNFNSLKTMTYEKVIQTKLNTLFHHKKLLTIISMQL